jgi:hypothetical protein
MKITLHPLMLVLKTCPPIALSSLMIWAMGNNAACAADPASLFPKTGVLLGAYAEPTTNTAEQATMMLENEIGRRFCLDHQYYQWQDGIPTSYETWTASQGRIPFVAWKPKDTNDLSPIRWSVITNGVWDWWITNRACAFKQFEQLTLMTFHHEPENDQDTPGVTNYGTAEEYQAAFRHVVSLFRDQGVTNVIWAVVLTQPSYTNPATGGRMQADRWYPGDDVVDVIGCDGYNWYPRDTNAVWTPFTNVFSGFYAWGTNNHQKPLVVAEFGCMEDTNNPNAKADWFAEIPNTIQQWPAVKAVCYFNFTNRPYPWNLDSSPASLAAFHAMGMNPYVYPPRPVTLNCVLSSGFATLQIMGGIGSTCQIEYADSPASTHWTTLTNVTLCNSPSVFVDSNPAAGVLQRFYRCP